MSEPRSSEETIFEAARQISDSGKQAEYLDFACGKDQALRQRVEQLLRAGRRAKDFFQRQGPILPSIALQTQPTVPVTEAAGTIIGRYKLLQQIGEGGCGVVYMAEQEEPIRRKVALKVIKLGMDTKSVVARFEAERQALALMDHPNIAKVLDAGATETGRPYFVMELVRGIKITDYCDQKNLSTHERLGLFVQVCEAVQHAHQKGIIHRDLKPSNILVASNDGVPIPKVIDFGIAKATQGRLTDQTLFTAFEQFMGTPAYMSPEQAELTMLDVDTRTDVYSLGVLLYELLTGRTPFDAKELLEAGLDAMRRTIREREPARPSTRLSTLLEGELDTTALHRHTEAVKLIHLLRGDLDWIVMKCLEKDRARRYETASGLASDVQRYLANDVVTARPPSRLYKFQKLVRRNKLVFAAIGAVLAALLFGLGLSTWLLVRETQARRAADEARREQALLRQKAEAEAGKRQKVADFLTEILNWAGPLKAQGRDTSVFREILDETEQGMAERLKDDPESESLLRYTIAGIYYQLAEQDKAEAMCRQALRLAEKTFGKESNEVVQCRKFLGQILYERRKFDEAEPFQRQTLELSKKVCGPLSLEVASTLNFLALDVYFRGDLPQAERLMKEALDLNRKLEVNWGPTNRDVAAEIANSLESMGVILLDRWAPEEAERAGRQVLSIRTNIFKEEDFRVPRACHNLALTLRQEGKLAEAEELQRRALAIFKKLMPDTHPYVDVARTALGIILRRRGSQAGDAAIMQEALEMNPNDQFAADALADVLAKPSLTPIDANAQGWRYTANQQSSNWFTLEASDTSWTFASSLSGSATYLPRTNPNPPPSLSLTNLWLRRTFDLAEVPSGKLVFRLNANHDARIFINGVLAAPAVDWGDTRRLVPASGQGRAALRVGQNLLAVHCQDADGGTPIEVRLFTTPDPTLARQQVIEDLDRITKAGPREGWLAALPFGGRAYALARMAQWEQAGTNLSKVIELLPAEFVPLSQLALLRVHAGDFSGYDQIRQVAIERFGNTGDPTMAARVSRVLLLKPAQPEQLKAAVALADRAGAASYPDAGLPIRQFSKGLAEYRQGHFAEANEWMTKLLVINDQPAFPGWTHARERVREVSALLVQAMALQGLLRTNEAGTLLSKAREIIQTEFPAEDCGDLGPEPLDWLYAPIFLREAQGK